MTQNNEIYLDDLTGDVIDNKHHKSVMMLIKVLHRLDIVDVELALKMATRFKILFV